MTNEYVNIDKSNANPHRVVAIVAGDEAISVVAIGSDGVYRSHVIHRQAPTITRIAPAHNYPKPTDP